MDECIALLRGINVGKAKRVAMADLRELIQRLGYENVRTLLNSGNVVFSAKRPSASKISAAIEAAIEERFGFSSRVVVIDASTLNAIIEMNPLLPLVKDPSKHLVAFSGSSSGLASFKALLARPWAPEALALTDKAAYLWCPNGLNDSKLALEFMRASGESATTRNWATVLKLQAMVAGAK